MEGRCPPRLPVALGPAPDPLISWLRPSLPRHSLTSVSRHSEAHSFFTAALCPALPGRAQAGRHLRPCRRQATCGVSTETVCSSWGPLSYLGLFLTVFCFNQELSFSEPGPENSSRLLSSRTGF